MTNQKISQLTDGGALQAADLFPISRFNGSTYDNFKVTGNTLLGIGAWEDSSSTNYTAVLADQSKAKNMTSNSPITFTIPPNASVAFPLWTQIMIRAAGTGQITMAPGSGVTFQSKYGNLKSEAQYAAIVAIKIATNTWHISGELVP